MELVALAIFLCGGVVGGCLVYGAQIIADALEQPEQPTYSLPAPSSSVTVYPEQRRRPVTAPQRVS